MNDRMEGPQADLDPALLAECQALAAALEAEPTDLRLELRFRQAVDRYVDALREQGGDTLARAAEQLCIVR